MCGVNGPSGFWTMFLCSVNDILVFRTYVVFAHIITGIGTRVCGERVFGKLT